MVIQRPQLEQSERTHYIPPKGEYETFRDESHYKEKLKEWGLSTAKEAKIEFWYKEKNYQRLVTIKGYETYGKAAEINTIVIEFQDGNVSCIHPAYLKEMQQSSFGKESMLKAEEKDSVIVEENSMEENKEAPLPQPKKMKEPKPKKEKEQKIDLPVDKVHVTASVKQFSMTYNAFTEENDEVVILENVHIDQELPITLEYAWCSHSKTLKKFELTKGDSLEFDGKVTAKKLPKGKDVPEEFELEIPVKYKINNPSKIIKK